MAFVACFVALCIPARADAVTQPIEVARPAGQLVLEMQGDDLIVTDTRAGDPGWSVSGVQRVVATTPAFTDGSGLVYAQRVALHNGGAIAAAHHGLGIAHLSVTAHNVTITII